MQPYTRHDEVLILNRRPGSIDANYFNRAQTALKRIGHQIRFKIPTLNHLDLIVQEDAWIIVGRVLNDGVKGDGGNGTALRISVRMC